MITKLTFDSKFFNKKIGKIIYSRNYTLNNLISDITASRLENYDCIYLETPSNRKDLIEFCRKNKFLFVDKRLLMMMETTNRCKNFELLNNINVSLTKEFINQIADEISKVSKFYKDPNFRESARNLYQLWINKSIYSGFCLKYFVICDNNKPAGIATLRMKEDRLCIDLFGVLEKFRTKGYGSQLLITAHNWAYLQGFSRIYLNTQDGNNSAVSVYRKNGFKDLEKYNIYHIHF